MVSAVETVSERREVVQQARRPQRSADMAAERLEVLLLVAEEHRHRQQQCAAAGVHRRPVRARSVWRIDDPPMPTSSARSRGSRVRRASNHALRSASLEVRILARGPGDADARLGSRVDEESTRRSNVSRSSRPRSSIGVTTAANRPASRVSSVFEGREISIVWRPWWYV